MATEETLKELALRLGASVRLSNGETFNASGSTGRLAKAPPPAKVEKPAQGDELLAKIVELLATRQAINVAVPELPQPNVVVEPPHVVVQPAPVVVPKPVSWKFTFERNDNGTIRSITATPKE